MKGNPTRILLVEDNPGDARLIQEMLAEAEDASFEIDWAPQLSAGLEKLSRGEIDLVLLDLGLPDSRGLDTFVKAYSQAPQIPFVVLTGLDDQTLALSAVREGAQDYLVKGQTDGGLLLRAIRYATERKRIEEELRLANEELRREIEERRAAEMAVEAERQRLFALLDGLPAMVSLIAPDFSLLFGNRVFGKLFGDWQGKRCYEAIFGKGEPCEGCPAVQVMANRASNVKEMTIPVKDRVFNIYFYPFTDVDGTALVLSLGIDITERKRAEEALEAERHRLFSLLDGLPGLVYLKAPDYSLKFANRQFREICGDWEGKKCYEAMFKREAPCENCTQFRVLETGQPSVKEATFAESHRTYQVYSYPFADVDGASLVLTLGIDITQRKQAEEGLKESERKYRLLVKAIPAVVFKGYADWSTEFFDNKVEELTGYNKEEFNSRRLKWSDLILEQDLEPARQAFIQALKDDGAYLREYRIRTKDGHILWIQARGQIVFNSDGTINHVSGVFYDITELKQAEEEIILNEARLASLLRIFQYPAASIQELLDFALNEAITLTGSKIGYIYFYDEATQQFTLNTWSKEVMQECTIAEPQTVYQLEKTGIWGEAVRQARPIMVNDFQAPNPLKKGYPEGHAALDKYLTIPVFSSNRIVAVVAVANKAYDYDEADVRQLTLMMDAVWKITERKQAEEALQRQQEEQQVILDSVPAMIFYKDIHNRFVRVNRAMAEVTGLAIEEVEGKLAVEVFPDYAADYFRDDQEVIASGSPKRNIIEAVNTAAGLRWVQTDKIPYRDDSGNIIGVIGFSLDITERKRAEEELQQSQARLAKAQWLAHLGNWEWNLQSGEVIWSEEVYRICGLDPQKTAITREASLDFVHPEDLEQVKNHLNAALAGERPFNTVSRLVRPDGSVRYIHAQAEVIFEENGQPRRMVGTAQDITERRTAEMRLRESEARFRAVFESAAMGITLTKMNGAFITANKAYQEMIGYGEEELRRTTWLELTHADDRNKNMELYEELKSGQRDYFQLEKRYRRKNGQYFWGRVTVSLVKDFEGKPLYVIAMVEDISQTRQAEEQLIESEENLRHLASQLFTAQEDERKRISRELHDELGQALLVLKLQGRAIEGDLQPDQQQLREDCLEMLGNIDQVVDNVRRLSRDLSPTLLEDLGLSAALRHLITEFGKHYQIKYSLQETNIDVLFPLPTQIAIYRIIQESLTNIGKHSQADLLLVAITRHDDRVSFLIQDNGKGFDPAQLRRQSPGMGLAAMEERARMVGGVLSIWSQEGVGTKISLDIPY